jgi:ABC-type Na+ efflux pump permease subunit
MILALQYAQLSSIEENNMSKQKTVQKKQSTHKGPPPKTHQAEKQKMTPFEIFMVFFIYFVVCLLIASLVYMLSGQNISDLVAWLLPLAGAAILTGCHYFLNWPKPRL